MSISPVVGPDRDRWAVVVILDISDTVRLQERLRRSETMSAMGALVAGVAHEVRNPLFGISATLDAFESKFKRRTEYRRYLDVLRERVGRLNELMRQLLDYGKPPRLDLDESCPQEVMTAAVVACAPLADQTGVAVAQTAEPGLPRLVVDRGRVVQIFQNLLENAIQHSPAGGRVPIPGGDGGGGAGALRGGGLGAGLPRRGSRPPLRAVLHPPPRRHRPRAVDRAADRRAARRRGGGGQPPGGGGAVMTVTLPVSYGDDGRLRHGHEPAAALTVATSPSLARQLAEDVRRAARAVEKIEGDAVAAVLGEELADLVVVVRPVGPHRHHVVILERPGDLGGVENQPLVDLAGEAPVGGDVHEDELAAAGERFGPGAVELHPGDQAGGLRSGQALPGLAASCPSRRTG